MKVKQTVLKCLENDKGNYISGEELAKEICVSRNAIWKAVQVLREEGYDIAANRAGYSLRLNSDILSEIKVRSCLKDEGWNVIIHKNIGSTNQSLIELATCHHAPHKTVLAAEEQTKAESYHEAGFRSPNHKGLYMSLLLRPMVQAGEIEHIRLNVCESVCEAIKRKTGTTVIERGGEYFWKEFKVCAMLSHCCMRVEDQKVEWMIMGIGIHVHADPGEFGTEGIPTKSLTEIAGAYCNRSELLAEILNCLDEKMEGWGK